MYIYVFIIIRISSNSNLFKMEWKYYNKLLPFIPCKNSLPIDVNPLKQKDIITLKDDDDTIYYNINILLPLLSYIFLI